MVNSDLPVVSKLMFLLIVVNENGLNLFCLSAGSLRIFMSSHYLFIPVVKMLYRGA